MYLHFVLYITCICYTCTCDFFSCFLINYVSIAISPPPTPLEVGDDSTEAPPPSYKKLFYEELVYNWITAHPATRPSVYCNAWFFFELLVHITILSLPSLFLLSPFSFYLLSLFSPSLFLKSLYFMFFFSL